MQQQCSAVDNYMISSLIPDDDVLSQVLENNKRAGLPEHDVATGAKAAITGMDWLAMALICFVLPAVLAWLFGLFFRRIGWIREGDLTLE